MFSSKKGQSGEDIIILVVMIFFIALFGLLMVLVWNHIDTGIQATGIDATAKAASSSVNTNLPSGFDIAIVIALALGYMGLFITSANIPVNPIYFFLNLFFIILSLGFGAIMSNVFDATNTNDFALSRASMPATVFVLGHLLEFTVLAAIIVLIGLFAKPFGGGE